MPAVDAARQDYVENKKTQRWLSALDSGRTGCLQLTRPPTATDPRVLTVGRINLDFYVSDAGRPHAGREDLRRLGGRQPDQHRDRGAAAGRSRCGADSHRGRLCRRARSTTAQRHRSRRSLGAHHRGGTDVHGDPCAAVPGRRASASSSGPVRPTRCMTSSHADGPAVGLTRHLAPVGRRDGLRHDALDRFRPQRQRRGVATSRCGGTSIFDRPRGGRRPTTRRAVTPVVAHADVVIGTEEEFTALLGLDQTQPRRSSSSAVMALDLPRVALKLGPDGIMLITDGAVEATSPVRIGRSRLHRRRR